MNVGIRPPLLPYGKVLLHPFHERFNGHLWLDTIFYRVIKHLCYIVQRREYVVYDLGAPWSLTIGDQVVQTVGGVFSLGF